MAQVLVTGASGYIGGRLVPELLEAGHQVRCLARTPKKLDEQVWRDDVEVAEGDVTDGGSLDAVLKEVGTAYFLVHSMGATADYADEDRNAAATFRDACDRAGVGRIVYLGGLGRDDDPNLSQHLQSRHEVGRVLADGPVPVTELRAAIIIGSGSASFEMLRYLVEMLPVMTTPKWVDNRCQPIAIRDVLVWLVGSVGCADSDDTDDHIHEIGGPDVITYREMMQVYAEAAGLARRRIVVVPVLSPSLSSRWVGLVTPLPTGLARPLVESLINEVVVEHPPADVPFDRDPLSFRDALDLALQRSAEVQVRTRWSDASRRGRSSALPLPSDPEWAGGSLLVASQQRSSTASPSAVFATVSGIGGDRGWYAGGLWSRAQSLLGRRAAAGGRVRPDPDRLAVGDHVDSWRVEEVEHERLIRLRSDADLPGESWLQWQVEPAGDGGSKVVQQAIFYPRGLLGRVWWYGLAPLRAWVDGRMLHGIAAAAEQRGDPVDPTDGAPVATGHRSSRRRPLTARRRTPTRARL